MSDELKLMDDDEGLLECSLPNGDKIAMDIFELEMMHAEAFSKHDAQDLPARVWLTEMQALIHEQYDVKLSLRNVDAVMGKQQKMISALKKNTPQSSEAESTTESSQKAKESSNSTE